MKFLSVLVSLTVFVSFSEAIWTTSYRLKFYYQGDSINYNQNNAALLLKNSNFKATNPTVLYLYGLSQEPDANEVKIVRDAYVSSGYNFILFDVNAAYYNYLTIEPISTQIAQNLVDLFNAGLDLQSFELVGFSIGAQFAGYISRSIKSITEGNIILPKIFALEPAVGSPIKVGPGDATFVMTIHTGNSFSDPTIVGDVAFYPNTGLKQPMCQREKWVIKYDDINCSHSQVQHFWAEAVSSQSETAFPAVPCEDDVDFYNNLCNSETPIGYMNPKVSNTLTGKYFLSTNLNSPFARETALP